MKTTIPICFLFFALLAPLRAADPKRLLQDGLFAEQVNRDLQTAMKHYQELLLPYDARREWVATAVFRLGECYRKLGQTNEMVVQFERVVKEFSDQTNLVANAKLHLQGAGRLMVRQDTPLDELNRLFGEMEEIRREQSETKAMRIDWERFDGNPDQFDAILARFEDPGVSNLFAQLEAIVPRAKMRDFRARTEKGQGDKITEQSIGKAEMAQAEKLSEMLDTRIWQIIEARERRSKLLDRKLEIIEGAMPVLQSRLAQGKVGIMAKNADATIVSRGTNTISPSQIELQEIIRIVRDSPDRLFTQYKKNQTPMEFAIDRGNVEAVEFLMKAGVSGTNRGVSGESMLSRAVLSGNLSITKLLLPSAMGDPRVMNLALQSAADRGYSQLTSYLIQRGADVNLIPQNSSGALGNAVYRGHGNIVRLLLTAGAEVNKPRIDGKPLLSVMVARGGTDAQAIAGMLLKAGADPDAYDDDGAAALHLASKDAEMTALLLKGGADPGIWSRPVSTNRVTSADGDKRIPPTVFQQRLRQITRSIGGDGDQGNVTPLHVAQRVEVAKLLLDHGANVNAREKRTGVTPLLAQAQRARDYDMFRLFLDHGADPNAKVKLSYSGSAYVTTPFLTIADGRMDGPGLKMVEEMLAAGADPNFAYSGDKASFMGRIMMNLRNEENLLELLVKAGANPELVPEEFVFLYAVDQGSSRPKLWELLPLLIKNGADVNRARDGFSPLKAAISRKSTNVVALLLKAGANPNQSDANGNTPLDAVFSALNSSPPKSELRKIYETLREQLVAAGADYASSRADAITLLLKDSGLKWPVLLKENHPYSEFTLLELVAHAFNHKDLPSLFRHPDFTKVRRHRPTKGGYDVTTHDILALASDTNALPVKLAWGDVLEFETQPYEVGARWRFPFELTEKMARRTVREVTLHFGKEPVKRVLSTRYSRAYEGTLESRKLFGSCWLTELLSDLSFLTTHDLSRIVVERKSGEEEVKRWLFDYKSMHRSVSYSAESHRADHWLQDGDVITIPKKTDEIEMSDYPFKIGIVYEESPLRMSPRPRPRTLRTFPKPTSRFSPRTIPSP